MVVNPYVSSCPRLFERGGLFTDDGTGRASSSWSTTRSSRSAHRPTSTAPSSRVAPLMRFPWRRPRSSCPRRKRRRRRRPPRSPRRKRRRRRKRLRKRSRLRKPLPKKRSLPRKRSLLRSRPRKLPLRKRSPPRSRLRKPLLKKRNLRRSRPWRLPPRRRHRPLKLLSSESNGARRVSKSVITAVDLPGHSCRGYIGGFSLRLTGGYKLLFLSLFCVLCGSMGLPLSVLGSVLENVVYASGINAMSFTQTFLALIQFVASIADH